MNEQDWEELLVRLGVAAETGARVAGVPQAVISAAKGAWRYNQQRMAAHDQMMEEWRAADEANKPEWIKKAEGAVHRGKEALKGKALDAMVGPDARPEYREAVGKRFASAGNFVGGILGLDDPLGVIDGPGHAAVGILGKAGDASHFVGKLRPAARMGEDAAPIVFKYGAHNVDELGPDVARQLERYRDETGVDPMGFIDERGTFGTRDQAKEHLGIKHGESSMVAEAQAPLPLLSESKSVTKSVPMSADAFSQVEPGAFHAAISGATDVPKGSGKAGDFLTVYEPEEYADMKTFLSPDGKTGFAVKPDGDLVSVFNVGERGAGKFAVERSLREGATKLDAFDGYLPELYKKYGFEEYKREANWTAGEPDVVYMQRPFSEEFLRDNYPTPATPEVKFDKKKGKEYAGRGTDAPNESFWEDRKAAQADIEAGNYSPLFDESQRFHVDPANYPGIGEPIPGYAKPSTREEWKKVFDNKETRTAWEAAYDAGSVHPDAYNWYAMGQLEEAAVKELGETAGRTWFRENFADAMASTTSGQAPTENLMMAGYLGHLRRRGLPVPESSLIPKPISGSYMGNNLQTGMKVADEGWDIAKQPKGYRFSGDFMGDTRPTIDKQGMIPSSAGAIEQGKVSAPYDAPPGHGRTYPIIEDVVSDLAAKRGVTPRDYQDVAWAGIKGETGKPMIRHVNEAIERTARLTGQTPDEVLRRWIRENAPLYTVAGLTAAGAAGGGILGSGGAGGASAEGGILGR